MPSCRLVHPAGCHIASCHPLVAPPSCQLVASACCRIASPRPLVAPRATLSSSRRTGWLLRRLLSARHVASCAGCRVIMSCHSLVAPHCRPLIVLAGCCVACPCAALSSSCLSPSPTPSNAIERCCRHRTPPPPPPLNNVSTFPRCHSCRPSSPSNTNAHLRPIAAVKPDARRRHPPPLMSISILASTSPIRIRHRLSVALTAIADERCCHH